MRFSYGRKRGRKASGKKKWLALSLPDLKRLADSQVPILADLRSKISSIDSRLPSAKLREPKYKEEMGAMETQRRELTRVMDSLFGLLGDLFTGSRARAKAEIDELGRRIGALYREHVDLGGIASYLESERSTLCHSLSVLEKLHENNVSRITYLQSKEKKISEREARKANVKALAAAHLGKSRKVAVGVRNQLKKHDFCPYCFGAIGDQPNADHIIPVAHGGLSTLQNMVFVCWTCNNQKGDKTLRQFCIEQRYSREKIEAILERLGKRV